MSGSLTNKNFVLTRYPGQSSSAVERLVGHGAVVHHFPALKIVPVKDYTEFDTALMENEFDYLILTSANAAEYFSRRVQLIQPVQPAEYSTAAVGKKTAEACESLDIKVDILPQKFNASGLLEYFRKLEMSGKKILIPASALARNELSDGLREMGALVYSIPVYDVRIPAEEDILRYKTGLAGISIDMYLFTSPSAFDNFSELMNVEEPAVYFASTKIAAIGPTTRSAIEKIGLKVDLMPDQYTMDALADSIIKFYEKEKS